MVGDNKGDSTGFWGGDRISEILAELLFECCFELNSKRISFKILLMIKDSISKSNKFFESPF